MFRKRTSLLAALPRGYRLHTFKDGEGETFTVLRSLEVYIEKEGCLVKTPLFKGQHPHFVDGQRVWFPKNTLPFVYR